MKAKKPDAGKKRPIQKSKRIKKIKEVKKHEPNKIFSTTGFNTQHELIITPMFSCVSAAKAEEVPKEELDELKTLKD